MKQLVALVLGSVMFPLALCGAESHITVATLHPLLTDLTRQIGGDQVEVMNLFEPGGDVHHFEISAIQLAQLKRARIIFASGKGLEPFLGKLRESLPHKDLVEVGATVPSLKSKGIEHHHHEHGHDEHDRDDDHLIDPHWWHTPNNVRRGAQVIARELRKHDPGNAATYDKNLRRLSQSLNALHQWAKREIAKIPEDQRKLVTAHTAFTYFCAEYGFEAIPILGISREQEASPLEIVEVIQQIRKEKLRAVFPEDQANPKVLAEVTRATGVVVGRPLIADGTARAEGSTFEGMFRHNVNAIVSALAEASARPQE